MQNSQGHTAVRLDSSFSGTFGNQNATSQNVSRTQVMHADTLSAVESALLLGSFLTLAASLASLAAL